MRRFYIVLLLCLSFSYGFTQQATIDCNLRNSYVNQKIGSWNVYIYQINLQIQKAYSIDLVFKRMLVRHFYIAHLLFNKGDEKIIETQLESFRLDIETLEKSPKYKQQCMAFRSALHAYNAVKNPLTAVYYLPKSYSFAKDAINKQANSPYSWAEYANLEYCYRLFLGGNFNEAIKAYAKAISLFETQKLNTSCNWYYINSLLFLAKCYEGNKEYVEANKVYNKILVFAPDFTAIHRWKHKF